jgi:hypothetical protein
LDDGQAVLVLAKDLHPIPRRPPPCSEQPRRLVETLSTRSPAGRPAHAACTTGNSMMTDTAPIATCTDDVQRGPANRAGKSARRGHPVGIRRMVGLETAAAMLGGQEKLADALGITVRDLRAKVSADRGVSNLDLLAAALALDARAALIVEHARKLRTLAAQAGIA